LITIYAAATGESPESVEARFAGQGYGVFKPAVGEAVVELLRPIREKTMELLRDKGQLECLYRQGAEKASARASRTLNKVRRKIGFADR
ncbi:MAG: tryptophan--tRNA ligase, partial [Oscillospiraceae bacterium]|nr:tryptophan--tRNA ligase [Oscillospiraceae bacterium]